MNTKRTPKFCNKCGKKLVINVDHTQYDIYEGHPIESVTTYECPDYKVGAVTRKANEHYYEVVESKELLGAKSEPVT